LIGDIPNQCQIPEAGKKGAAKPLIICNTDIKKQKIKDLRALIKPGVILKSVQIAGHFL
jgi:hypothetical protein